MKIEYKLFVILAAFFAPVGLIYGIFTGWREPVGAAGLLLSSGLGIMIAFYLWATARRLPEGEYGFFSPHSWWPLPLAAAGAMVFLGLAIGWWLFIIGATFGVIALVGWTFEYFKGPHAV